MRRLFLATLMMMIVSACTTEEQLDPVDTTVTVVLSNPLELQPAAPVRYAVIWTLAPEPGSGGEEQLDPIADARAWVGADGLVPAATFQVPLTMPPAAVSAAARPQEILELRRPRTTPCFRPRVVIYEDADGTGGFSPDAFGIGGSDRVLAVDFGPGICALLDIEAALDGAGLELTETYYLATDYMFTSFVPVTAQGGLAMRLDGEPLSLRLTDSPGPRESLACLRQATIPPGPSLFATSRVSAHVDDTLDADVLCSAIFPECESIDLETTAPPAIELPTSDAVGRVFGCRQAERVEVFIAQEAELVCDECSCFTQAHSEVFFADPASPPAWWPCGDPVQYCESDLPLYTLDPLCDFELPEEEEEEEEP